MSSSCSFKLIKYFLNFKAKPSLSSLIYKRTMATNVLTAANLKFTRYDQNSLKIIDIGANLTGSTLI